MGKIDVTEADKMLKATMEEFGISRETAAIFIGKTFEYMLKHNDDKAAMDAFIKDVYAAVQNEEPWAVEYIGAYNRRMLPEMVKAYDKAVDLEQDPATVISITLSIPMDAATASIAAIKAFRSGSSLEEVTLAMVLGAQEADTEEIKRRLDA